MRSAQKFDWPDFAALLLSGLLAAIAPLQVFLLAYALLGPFHYLTEIAWLRSKQLYLREGLISSRNYLLLAVVLAALAPLQYVVKHNFGFWVVGLLLLLSLTVWVQNIYVLAAIGAAGFVAKFTLRPWLFLIAVLVPTLIHVYFFTWTFMVSGALRSKRSTLARWINPALLMVIPLALVSVRLSYPVTGAFWLHSEADSFADLHGYIANSLHHTFTLDAAMLQDPLIAALIRLFAFVYLFHYLNWFAKTELLQWHKISRPQWSLIGVVYAASIALYFWNFRAGFLAAAFLSLLHVLLEFPLNWHTLRFLSLRLRGKTTGAPATDRTAIRTPA